MASSPRRKMPLPDRTLSVDRDRRSRKGRKEIFLGDLPGRSRTQGVQQKIVALNRLFVSAERPNDIRPNDEAVRELLDESGPPIELQQLGSGSITASR